MHSTPLAELKITAFKVISFTFDLMWTSGVKEHSSLLNLGLFLNLSPAAGSNSIPLPTVCMNMLASVAASYLVFYQQGPLECWMDSPH